ncbi:AzlD domain-containing protein [Tepidamorphus sp. 3E244]|uniref:AzlD domain-containing protein n=1 Tax=Tepidamorphus sp. 3E244 TaxID=3385498 RepID=UPI0038FC2F9F
MTSTQWILIAGLAVATFAMRYAGMMIGERVSRSRFAPLLEDLPGLIVVALVGSSLANAEPVGWLAAIVAAGVAWVTRNVPVTMAAGLAAFIGLQLLTGAV